MTDKHESDAPDESAAAPPEQPDEHPTEQQVGPHRLPEFSRRLGAPIATVRPAGRPPSQVTGLPSSADSAASDRDAAPDHEAAARSQTEASGGSSDLGHLPPPGGEARPLSAEPKRSSPGESSGGASGAEQQSFYDAVGGHETFQKIVDVFYGQVAEDPEFRAMYPEEDLEPAKERLLMFLEQYWGGPKTYQERRGHPRLRMRHMQFRVDPAARDTWLKYMRTAVEAAELSPMHEEILWDYLQRAAHSMVNS